MSYQNKKKKKKKKKKKNEYFKILLHYFLVFKPHIMVLYNIKGVCHFENFYYINLYFVVVAFQKTWRIIM